MDSLKEMYITTHKVNVTEYMPTQKSGRFLFRYKPKIFTLDANTLIQVTSTHGNNYYGNIIDGDERIHIEFNKAMLSYMTSIDTEEYKKFKFLLELYKKEYEFENVKLANPRVPQEASKMKGKKSRSSTKSGGRKTSKKRK